VDRWLLLVSDESYGADASHDSAVNHDEASYDFVATVSRGLEPLLADELQSLGCVAEAGRGVVGFSGDLSLGCRVAMWSRLASRVLLPLGGLEAPTPEALYEGAAAIDWEGYFDSSATLAIECNGSGAIGHTQYAALKVKDAVVDRFRARSGVRPNIDVANPDILLCLHLRGEKASLYVDVGGGALHRRGYRRSGGQAPLRETLAAAILWRAGWPQKLAEAAPLLDPMCGSGTLVLEAALMAADVAPGLGRGRFGLHAWKTFPGHIWEELLDEARQRRQEGGRHLPELVGWDVDGKAIETARRNAVAAGLETKVRFERRGLAEGEPIVPEGPGLAVVNPPYGVRMDDEAGLEMLYARLGEDMRRLVPGWDLAVFTGSPRLVKMLRLKPRRSYSMFNGPLRCRLLLYDLSAKAPAAPVVSEGAQMLENRLRKNYKRLGKLVRNQGVTCYRVYDADLPEYAFAVDLYCGDRVWCHMQEYAPPASIDVALAAQRRSEAVTAVAKILEIAPGDLFFKMRRRQRGTSQYGRQQQAPVQARVAEGKARFWVNFSEYLDTGLFLDHRLVRQRLAELAVGGDFLNLFGYTATATVQAALGGASRSITVDMSRTYLDWAGRNFDLNRLNQDRHQLVLHDCMTWLTRQRGKRVFDVVYVNPPTFSNSKSMGEAFSIDRDQGVLLGQALALVRPGGTLLFSTHARRFTLDTAALEQSGAMIDIEETTQRMVPFDFQQRSRAFRSWEIQVR
jgi:23S rRNA (guanine2445-N2)-methyltransferase / 23S rRNA (guanine2069-N7)-methyltransferase